MNVQGTVSECQVPSSIQVMNAPLDQLLDHAHDVVDVLRGARVAAGGEDVQGLEVLEEHLQAGRQAAGICVCVYVVGNGMGRCYVDR